MMMVLAIAAGGALGAVLRYGVMVVAVRLFGVGFPAGTLSVNVIGSLLIGLAAGWLMTRGGEDMILRGFVITGCLGAFTTFSAFSLDVMGLLERQQLTSAAAYILASVILSLLAAFAGLMITRGGV